MAIFSGVGKLIGFKYKSAAELGRSDSLLELSLTIPTGEKKKEGVEYAPSNIWKVTLWGAYAEALKDRVYVSEGQPKQRLEVSGGVGVPDSYINGSGNAATSMKLVNPKVEIIDWKPEGFEEDDSEKETEVAKTSSTPAPASSASSKKKGKKDSLLDAVSPDFSDLDFIGDDEIVSGVDNIPF